MDYRTKAIACVKDTVLPREKKLFQECNYDIDTFYSGEDTDNLFTRIIEPGHIYEVGYPECVCGEVLSGKVKEVSHCECSRQSVLYILQELMPDKNITVETIETVLGGADCCRFRVVIE